MTAVSAPNGNQTLPASPTDTPAGRGMSTLSVEGPAASGQVPVVNTDNTSVSWGSAGGGGSTPGAARVLGPFPFAYNTVGINNGVTFYTPTVNDILIEMWVEITTAFNGTTPKADIGTFTGGATNGWWSNTFTDVINLTHADADQLSPSGTSVISQNTNGIPPAPATALQIASEQLTTNFNQFTRVVPGRFTAATPLKVVVSQDGSVGGTAVGGTAGAGAVYLIVATPSLV